QYDTDKAKNNEPAEVSEGIFRLERIRTDRHQHQEQTAHRVAGQVGQLRKHVRQKMHSAADQKFFGLLFKFPPRLLYTFEPRAPDQQRAPGKRQDRLDVTCNLIQMTLGLALPHVAVLAVALGLTLEGFSMLDPRIHNQVVALAKGAVDFRRASEHA